MDTFLVRVFVPVDEGSLGGDLRGVVRHVSTGAETLFRSDQEVLRLLRRATAPARRVGKISAAVDQQIETIEAGWRRFRVAVDRLGPDGLERQTTVGWTVKELVAHVAFWEETVNPVVNGMYRGREVPLEDWYGGEELGLAPGDPWPTSSVHNAREAAWARSRSPDEVIARWDRAHERLLAVVRTITDEEAEREEYLGKIGAATYEHYAEHLSELEVDRLAEQLAQERDP